MSQNPQSLNQWMKGRLGPRQIQRKTISKVVKDFKQAEAPWNQNRIVCCVLLCHYNVIYFNSNCCSLWEEEVTYRKWFFFSISATTIKWFHSCVNVDVTVNHRIVPRRGLRKRQKVISSRRFHTTRLGLSNLGLAAVFWQTCARQTKKTCRYCHLHDCVFVMVGLMLYSKMTAEITSH